jgi:hypothetical protein
MAGEKKSVKLATADYRVSFDSGVKGVDTIRPAHLGGTEVPQNQVEAVEEAAKKRNVKLRKL